MSGLQLPASLGEAYARRTAEARAEWDRLATEPPAPKPEPKQLPQRPRRGHLADVPDEVLRFTLEAAELAWDLDEAIDWSDLIDELAYRIDWAPADGDWDGPIVAALKRWTLAQRGEA